MSLFFHPGKEVPFTQPTTKTERFIVPQKLHYSIHPELKQVSILVGNSGAGKSTLAKGIRKIGIGFGYLGTGDRLREAQAKSSPLAKVIETYTSIGEHVPKDVIFPHIAGWFRELADHRLILSDGCPRNLEQVDDAFKLFHEAGFLSVSTIYIDTPASKCAHHLLLQAEEARQNGEERNDGDEEAMANRLSKFPTKVQPILDVLRERCDHFVHVETANVSIKDPLVVRDIAINAGIICRGAGCD
jgi:adenylate kinase family enzyme